MSDEHVHAWVCVGIETAANGVKTKVFRCACGKVQFMLVTQ